MFIDDETIDRNSRAQTLQAANALWALPWELLHDGTGYLSEGKQGGSVRRRLPNRQTFAPFKVDLPIKVLLVSPRPRDEGYIDHRITAKPMVQALQTLGHLAALTILSQPTLQALQGLLQKQSFHVLHFDGHGVYDRNKGPGALCFEQTATPPEWGKLDLVYADKLAAILREHRIPLVFLEACQSAQSENDAVKSVAAALLSAGIVSVAAMTHSVLVVSAELFVREFYLKLAQGCRIGEAMLAGQQALMNDKSRFDDDTGDGFMIEDWFVPVLYQEREDPALFNRQLPENLQALQTQQRCLALGELPDEPPRNLADAQAAKHRAIQSYLAYRREGGENMSGSQVPKLCELVLHAGGENHSQETRNILLALKDVPELPDYLKPVIPKLLAILQGERNTTLADAPALDYNSAAELLLLLEAL